MQAISAAKTGEFYGWVLRSLPLVSAWVSVAVNGVFLPF
jgi:hypothetical protein